MSFGAEAFPPDFGGNVFFRKMVRNRNFQASSLLIFGGNVKEIETYNPRLKQFG